MLQDYVDIFSERIAIVAANDGKRVTQEIPSVFAVPLTNYFNNTGHFARWTKMLSGEIIFSVSWN